jgi:hypothetical protein
MCRYVDERIRYLRRATLVEPYWEKVNICNTREESWIGAGEKRMCVTLAEVEGYILGFDRVDEQYHLAWRGEYGLGTWSVREGGVGCFMSWCLPPLRSDLLLDDSQTGPFLVLSEGARRRQRGSGMPTNRPPFAIRNQIGLTQVLATEIAP